jgi:16S rRNA (cytosine967-C5)-methyltransferase
MPRNLALRVLGLSRAEPGDIERVLDRELKKRKLDARDRAFALNLIQGVQRFRLRLDWVIKGGIRFSFKRMEPAVLNIVRIALYQILFMDRVPESAAVNEAVKQARRQARGHVAGFVNGLLREVCRRKEEITFPDRMGEKEDFLSVYYSYPPWMVRKWERELGPEELEPLLEAQNRTPRMIARVNTLRTDRQGLIEALNREGIDSSPSAVSPFGVVIEGVKGSITGLDSFKKGLFQVQGEAAQVGGALLSPLPAHRVLDICAGLGGKSTHLAQLMKDSGFIASLDINRDRLVSLNQTCRRLGLSSIHAVAGDAAGDLRMLFRGRFDRILIDPPCSALGTISRHPAKWTRSEDDVKRLAAIQSLLIDRAWPLLRKRGRMLYLTCTISKEENEDVIQASLERHRDMTLADLRQEGPEWAGGFFDGKGFFRAFPHRHGTEGFFGALLAKG